MKSIALFTLVMFVMFVAFVSASPPKPVKMKWVLVDGAPTILQKVIEDQPTLRAEKVESMQKHLGDLKAQLKKTKEKQAAQNLREKIKQIEAEIQAINSDEVIVISDQLPSQVGMVGQIEYVEILQVVDSTNALASMVRFTPRESYRDHAGRNHVEPSRKVEIEAWFANVDTSTWTDDQGRTFKGDDRLWYCDSTHQYETTDGGTRTLPKLMPFTLDSFQRVPAE